MPKFVSLHLLWTEPLPPFLCPGHNQFEARPRRLASAQSAGAFAGGPADGSLGGKGAPISLACSWSFCCMRCRIHSWPSASTSPSISDNERNFFFWSFMVLVLGFIGSHLGTGTRTPTLQGSAKMRSTARPMEFCSRRIESWLQASLAFDAIRFDHP